MRRAKNDSIGQKKAEEKLNELFISAYRMENEMSYEIEDKDVTVPQG